MGGAPLTVTLWSSKLCFPAMPCHSTVCNCIISWTAGDQSHHWSYSWWLHRQSHSWWLHIAGDRIISCTAGDHIIGQTAGDRIISCTACDYIINCTEGDYIGQLMVCLTVLPRALSLAFRAHWLLSGTSAHVVSFCHCSVAVMKHGDRDNLEKKAFNWGLVRISEGESMAITAGSMSASR